MRLEALELAGIKGFAERQRLDLRRLNLIYGANSSGKSTVLQTLLLLQQSSRRAFSAERGYLEFRGSSVDLGGYRTFVNMHDTERPIEIGLGLRDISNRTPLDLGDELTVQLRFELASRTSSEPTLGQVTLQTPENSLSFKLNEDNQIVLTDAKSAAALVELYFSALHEMDSRHRRVAIPRPQEGDAAWLRKWIRKQECTTFGWLPYWPMQVIAGRPGRPVGGSKSSPRYQLAEWLVAWWSEYVFELGTLLYGLLSQFVYVGPLREFPRRVVAEATDGTGVGVRGERLVLHLARNPDLVDKVNEAFVELNIPYALAVNTVSPGRIEDALGDVAVAVLTDKRNGVVVSPADVGFGLSQILPVVVQLVGNRSRTILIEQPEIHLHPKVQAKLADVLLSSVLDNDNRLIIETHSEHILTRLERRLGEETSSALPDDLGVYYVSTREESSQVMRMRIGSSGRVIDPWPDGFFDEELSDLIG